MTEKFYCVGSKQSYDLEVLDVAKKPSKGGSFRHSIISQSPPGHKVTKICKQEVYDFYADKLGKKAAESVTDPSTAGPSPAGGPADITPAGPSATPLERTDAGVPSDFEAITVDIRKDESSKLSPADLKKIKEISADIDAADAAGDDEKADELMEKFKQFDSESFEANEVVGTMSPGAGVNEALEPLEGGLENGDEPSLVPADSFQPQGNGHVIGQHTDSYNTTPMHAEEDFEPYFELSIVTNGTVGDSVGDSDQAEEEKDFAEWEYHVNEDGPHVLIYYDSADEAGMIVAGDDFMEVYDSESLLPTVRSNRKAIMASAAAALVIGLVWYRSSRSQ